MSPAALDYRLIQEGLVFEKRVKGMNSTWAAGLDLCQAQSPLGRMMTKTLHEVLGDKGVDIVSGHHVY